MSTTPMPWKLVPATEHHGPYITSPWGTTLCDLYVMSNPTALSTASGGTSGPLKFVDADDNACLIVTAVNSHDELLSAVHGLLDAIAGTRMLDDAVASASLAISKAEGRDP